ncbi:hypothetical protein Vretifemale_17140, partial [Volvox reticuliferus]
MECDSTPTLATRTQTSVPAAPVICPKPEGPFGTTASIDDLEVSGSWPRSTEVVPATLPIINKASFTKVKTWVIRAPDDNISKEKSTTSNNKSNSSNRGNFEYDLVATPLRNGLRQMADDTRQKLMAMRKATSQAFAKERWLGSWNFLKLQRQDEGGQAYLPAAAPAQMPAPYSALANSGEC